MYTSRVRQQKGVHTYLNLVYQARFLLLPVAPIDNRRIQMCCVLYHGPNVTCFTNYEQEIGEIFPEHYFAKAVFVLTHFECYWKFVCDRLVDCDRRLGDLCSTQQKIAFSHEQHSLIMMITKHISMCQLEQFLAVHISKHPIKL